MSSNSIVVSLMILDLKVKSENITFVTTLPCYSLCKMATFATFQNIVIFSILDVFQRCFFQQNNCTFLLESFVKYFSRTEVQPHGVPFVITILTITFAKWSFLQFFKILSSFHNQAFFRAVWNRRTVCASTPFRCFSRTVKCILKLKMFPYYSLSKMVISSTEYYVNCGHTNEMKK